MRAVKILGILALLLLLGWLVFAYWKSEDEEKVVYVEVDKPVCRDMMSVVGGLGELKANHQVPVAPDVSGEVTALYVEEGQSVQQGDLLLNIRPDNYSSILDRQRAQYAKAEVSSERSFLELAKAEVRYRQRYNSYQRKKELFEKCMISQAEFERVESEYVEEKNNCEIAEKNVKSSAYELQSATASVREAEENLALTKVYAPMAGIITYLGVQKGERVVGTRDVSGTHLMTISQLDDISAHIDIDESNITRVQVGGTAFVRVGSLLAYVPHVEAEVVKVSYLPKKVGGGGATFTVTVDILERAYRMLQEKVPIPYPLRPGVSADVRIVLSEAKNVLSVPYSAVVVRSDRAKKKRKKTKGGIFAVQKESGTEVMFLYKDGKAHLTKVETGISDQNYVEILSGLQESDTIITGPYVLLSRTLKDQQVVRLKPNKP